MISYLSGKIIAQKENWLIVEVNGIGYEVFVSQKTGEVLPEIGQTATVFCSLEANERGVKLYGFLTFEELELFKVIRNIQGIGPKAALEISSVGSIDKIKNEIEKGEAKFLDGIPNIGAKKAAKIILELSGKIKTSGSSTKKERDFFEKDETFLALLNLGFSKDQAKNALLQLSAEVKDPQEKIKQALKILGR